MNYPRAWPSRPALDDCTRWICTFPMSASASSMCMAKLRSSNSVSSTMLRNHVEEPRPALSSQCCIAASTSFTRQAIWAIRPKGCPAVLIRSVSLRTADYTFTSWERRGQEA
jgi:hypothetical protein